MGHEKYGRLALFGIITGISRIELNIRISSSKIRRRLAFCVPTSASWAGAAVHVYYGHPELSVSQRMQVQPLEGMKIRTWDSNANVTLIGKLTQILAKLAVKFLCRGGMKTKAVS
ncbi:hypothetical protein TNCV_4698471 [Trichonephila clavipes]|nr:hypothetical protein TNCV_4698471 [Trichonephila clavipes]